MNPGSGPGAPPHPPADLGRRSLPLGSVATGSTLYRVHRTAVDVLYFGLESDPVRRRRWDAPDASYGVCYMAFDSHIAFAETMLRDLALDVVHEQDLKMRSLARIEVCEPLHLVEMNGKHLRRLGADAAVVQGEYRLTWEWSAAFHTHSERPDGIRYRARHDDSGFSLALFGRAKQKIRSLASTPLLDPTNVPDMARWLDRYDLGLTS